MRTLDPRRPSLPLSPLSFERIHRRRECVRGQWGKQEEDDTIVLKIVKKRFHGSDFNIRENLTRTD